MSLGPPTYHSTGETRRPIPKYLYCCYFSCLFSSVLPLHGLRTYCRVLRVAFDSLTHNRLTAVSRLPDHSNSLLSVLLLESSSSTRVTPRPQLHLDCCLQLAQTPRHGAASNRTVQNSLTRQILLTHEDQNPQNCSFGIPISSKMADS